MIWYMSPNPHLVRPDRETMVRLTSEMNDRQISRLFGCTSPVIAKWRDLYGIPRSPRQSGGNTTKWQTDRDYFARIDTPEKAYALGFIIADGHVRKEGYKIEISVKEADAAILAAIARDAGCDAPLRPMTNHYDGSRMMRLRLCGKSIVSDLNALGVFHDKSKTAVYPAVPPELERHLARGLWDGDGWIGERQFSIIGTPTLLDGLVEATRRHTGCTLRRKFGGREGKYHYAYGTRRDAPVLDWMYSGASIALDRKVRAASSSYWTQVPRA
jgi:hypothetical protein